MSLLTVRPRPANVRAMPERLGLLGRDYGRRRRRGGRTDSTGGARVLPLLATLESDEIPSEGIIELARLAGRLGYEPLWVPEGHGWDAVAAVTDAMVDLVSIVGPAAECRERQRALEAAGVDEVALVLSAPGGDRRGLGAALAALAPA